MTAPKSEPSPESLEAARELYHRLGLGDANNSDDPDMQMIIRAFDSRERALREEIERLKIETRCPDCGCSTPQDAEREECGCESPVCARFIMNGPLGEQFKKSLAERDRAVRAAKMLIEAQGQAVKRAERAEEKLAKVVPLAQALLEHHDKSCSGFRLWSTCADAEAIRAALAGPESGGGE